jgi:heme/copper-type cytochrome/quinol oxidase subunit 4
MTERRALGLVVRILAYYAVLAGAAWFVAQWIPQWGAYFTDRAPGGAAVAMLGALALIGPVAWMYMRTKPKERYDASLVHTLIILPVVIAGIVLIVHDSVALAFSLAGIVAAVRFRNTLRDTKDAVYIFLAIAVGLAAGVQAFAVGFVVSVIYVAVVLVLWRFDIGTVPATERVRGRLVVETATPTGAHPTIAGVLEQQARRWKLIGSESAGPGSTALTFLVQLRSRATPEALVAAVRRDAAAQVTNVRFDPDPQ